MTRDPDCRWCGLRIRLVRVPAIGTAPDRPLEPPRCRVCNVPLCDPVYRDCAYEHWRHAHGPRRVENVRTSAV